MTSLATQVANAIASAYDFSGLGILVDVGGSHGALWSPSCAPTQGYALCCSIYPT